MKRQPILSWCVLLFGLAGARLHAQATPAASRTGSLQIGVGASSVSPDYGPKHASGFSGWVDFDFTQHIGVELMAHENDVFTPTDIGENTYLIGPRYTFFYRRFQPYIKVLVGIGVFKTQFDYAPHTSESYLAYAGGGGLDIRATDHFNIRAFDLEAQKWPSFGNGLSPYAGTIGVSYVFH